MKSNGDQKIKEKGAELLQFILLTMILFGFWLIMSGMWQVKFLVVGFAASLVIAWVTRPLLRIPSQTVPNKNYLAFNLPYLKLLAYVPWLLWEIIKANIDVVKLVLDPKMPISPAIITFEKSMSNPIAHVFLANSITLTPGTVTVDLKDGIYHVHAITEQAARSLVPAEGEGDMSKRVADLFNEKPANSGKGSAV